MAKKRGALRSLLTVVATGAAASALLPASFQSHQVGFLNREKNCLLAGLGFSVPTMTTLALCGLTHRFFSQGGPVVLINLRLRLPSSVFRQAGHSR